MRCPKCGAFMEDGKDICLMCGTNVKNYVPDQDNGNPFSKGDNTFGSGNDFMNPNMGGFNRNNSSNKNEYKNVTYAPIKNEEKDFFDKYAENKKLINVILICVLIGIVIAAGVIYFNIKNKPTPKKAKLQNLYFEVDDSLEEVSTSGSGKLVYIKSGDKGNACSITIGYGSSTSGDHVYEYFTKSKEALEPERDKEGNVIDEMSIYTADEGDMTMRGSVWYFLNIFYKTSPKGSPTALRYKYLTSVYKGYYYDIELVNNSNDATCNASLDNFAKTLEFLDN